MALNPSVGVAYRNAECDATVAQCNNGSIRLYTGTRPATADTALSGNTLLVTCACSATAAPAASGGVATFNAITSAAAVATGTATFFRAMKSDGTSCVFQGEVGTSGADLNLNSTSIQSGATVAISSLTYTRP